MRDAHRVSTTTLRRFDRADLDALRALQHATAGTGPRWSRAALEGQLTDPARDHGRRVVVAERGGAIVGAAGWVEAPPQLFGAPVLAADRDAADVLVAHLIAHARSMSATSLRISATDGDAAKVAALAAAGFAALFDLLTLARSTEALPVATTFRRRDLASLGVAALRDLHNETFAGVPNSPPLDDDDVQHVLARHWAEASGVWLDDGGEVAGFVIAVRDRDGEQDFVEDDSIAVRAPWQRRGLGDAMLRHMLAVAAGDCVPEARALIASTNAASLRLHERAGFAERSRRTVWELVIAHRAFSD